MKGLKTLGTARLDRPIIVGSRWIVTTHGGLNLADWGYLWYGEWRTRLGEIPLLDFQSYDPGRFYYPAMISSIVRRRNRRNQKELGPSAVSSRHCGAIYTMPW